MPIKIVHVITSLDRGGTQTALSQLVRNIDRTRFDSVVVSLMDDGAVATELAASGLRPIGLGMRRGIASPGAIWRLKRVLDRERPQILQSWLYHADLLSLVAAGLTPGVRLAWNLRCSYMALEHYSRQARLVRRILACASKRPDIVITNSEAGRRYHAALGYHARRWEIAANGFDTALFRPDPERRAAWREKFGLAADQPLIGMVARLDPMKDHATFLAAAQTVARERSDAAFVLVGAGTERLAVPPDLAFRLHALGERDDVRDILPALDLMVLSSLGEGFPNVIGEAMACGVPCISTDVGDAALLIDDSARVVPPRDSIALARAILAVLARGSDALAQLGAMSRRRILDGFSLGRTIERYQQIYQDLAGPCGPTA